MSKAEKFISDCTRNCSNEIIVPTQDGNTYTKGYDHWLTPDQARKAVEIAREEMLEKAKKWFEKQNEWINIDGTRHCDMESFEDFRNYMKDEKAEERALEKYPKKIEWIGNQWDGVPFDVNSESRVAYRQGYQQAEKELIDKATDWIEEINKSHYIMRYSDSCEVTSGELKEWFKNYMES